MILTVLPRAGANPELHHNKENTKNEGPSENMGFTYKPFDYFRPKTQNFHVWHSRTKQKNRKTSEAKTEDGPCIQEEVN